MTSDEISKNLKAQARRLGFDLAGICPAVTPNGVSQLAKWLDAGYAGEMQYLADRQHAYEHPRHVMSGVRSILMLAVNYRTSEPQTPSAGQARISRYAWGTDYHDLIHDRLRQLKSHLGEVAPTAKVRGVVDTAPLLEREFAQLAGLGWVGKNTLLLNREIGSWFFLAALLTDLQLEYDEPTATDHCGTCTACLDACPTDAFVEPYVLDSRKCISYLTIELKGSVPEEYRSGVGDWLFGCDVCQDVCPWNGRAPRSSETGFQPVAGGNPIELAELFNLSDDEFRQRFRSTPLWRPKRRGILRNAAIVLGNFPHPPAETALIKALSDYEPLVRGATAWALRSYPGGGVSDALQARLETDQVADVARAIQSALEIRER